MDSFNFKIRTYERSGANFKDGTIDLGLATFNSSDTWHSSVLIHETIHFWQYRSCKYIAATVTELEANKYQIDVLKKNLSAKNKIAHLASQNRKHADIKADGIYNWKGYIKTDW